MPHLPTYSTLHNSASTSLSPPIFSIEGNLGAGKSTLLALLGTRVIPQPVDSWQNMNGVNLLELYYKDPDRWAYLFQVNALASRCELWRRVGQFATVKRRKENGVNGNQDQYKITEETEETKETKEKKETKETKETKESKESIESIPSDNIDNQSDCNRNSSADSKSLKTNQNEDHSVGLNNPNLQTSQCSATKLRPLTSLHSASTHSGSSQDSSSSQSSSERQHTSNVNYIADNNSNHSHQSQQINSFKSHPNNEQTATTPIQLLNLLPSFQGPLFSQRSPLADRHVFGQLMYQDGHMNQAEYYSYDTLSRHLMNDLPLSGIIYLRCRPQVCLERIRKRNRKGEEILGMGYLGKVHARHEEWLGAARKDRTLDVLVIETEGIDLESSEQQEKLIKQVMDFANERAKIVLDRINAYNDNQKDQSLTNNNHKIIKTNSTQSPKLKTKRQYRKTVDSQIKQTIDKTVSLDTMEAVV